jgi:hypothetical protein
MTIRKTGRRQDNAQLLSAISFLLMFLIPAILFLIFQKSIFYYQEGNSLFIYSCDYLRKFLLKPGGLLEYSGLFLAQFYFSPLYGSLIVSAVIAATGLVFRRIQKQLSSYYSFLPILFIIPSCLLLIMQRSSDHIMAYNLGFVATGLWFLFSMQLDKKIRIAIPLLFPVFFYIAGFFSLLYVAMYIIYLVASQKGSSKYMLPLILLASALVSFILLKEILFQQPLKVLIFNPLSEYASMGFPVLFVILSFYVLFFPLLPKVFSGYLKLVSVRIRCIIVVIVLSIPALLLTTPVDTVMADNVCTEMLVRKKKWDEIISHHEKTPSMSVTGQYYYNLALAETGQLCSRMFKGRQDFGSGSLILHNDPPSDNEIYFDCAIGLVNEAHHLATESFVKNGYRPEIIKTLVRTDLISMHYGEAQKFVGLMKRTLHYRKWAKEYEQLISDTSLIRLNPDLGEKIKTVPGNDFFIKPFDSLNIESILKSDPENRTALEYKMALLLFIIIWAVLLCLFLAVPFGYYPLIIVAFLISIITFPLLQKHIKPIKKILYPLAAALFVAAFTITSWTIFRPVKGSLPQACQVDSEKKAVIFYCQGEMDRYSTLYAKGLLEKSPYILITLERKTCWKEGELHTGELTRTAIP